jgi:hypothetical protein
MPAAPRESRDVVTVTLEACGTWAQAIARTRFNLDEIFSAPGRFRGFGIKDFGGHFFVIPGVAAAQIQADCVSIFRIFRCCMVKLLSAPETFIATNPAENSGD